MDRSDREEGEQAAKPRRKPPAPKKNSRRRWILTITLTSFFLSIVMSYASNEALSGANTVFSFVVLLLFIGLGILFDMIGVAAASGTEKEFHSMAARRVRGARQAVWMVRNADRVSSICNDVVGDICGIISGATGALIVAALSEGRSATAVLLISLGITGLTSALTIGGKAAGKGVAMGYSGRVLAFCGKVLSIFPFLSEGKK